jgi:uncharacterized repeat protein (TIGR01451 family)
MSARTACVRLAAASSILVACLASSAASQADSTAPWTTYLYDNQHSSYNASDTSIAPPDVAGLTLRWKFHAPSISGKPPSRIYTSPTVYGGAVYIGSNTGLFYKLDEATGAVIWSDDLGSMPKATCRAKGMLATAAVAPDPVTGEPTVYVGAGDGNVDAIRASDGAVMWKSPVDTNPPGVTQNYDFSSPMVANGHVYEGISSSCDTPLDRGGLAEVDQHTGARLATYYTVPDGVVGGSIWSTPAITPDGSTIFVTTGNGDRTVGSVQGDSISIVALDANTLVKTDIWTIPASDVGPDSDFGGSPTLFTANLNGTPTAMVGAVNKNGNYYAWKQDDLASGPVWFHRFGAKSEVAAAVWDGSHLFLASGATKINGTSYAGGIREINPDNGQPIWETGVSAADLGFGSPSMDGGGVLAVPTYNTVTPAANVYYMVDTSTGTVLRQFPLAGPSFPQAVFADDLVFITDGAQGAATLYAYGTGGATNGADISVSQQTSAGPVVADQPLTYTVTVANDSATDATGVSLQDTVPPGVQQGSVGASQGSCSGTGTVTCPLGTIAAGGSATVTITVTPIAPGNITNTATVTPSDATPLDNTSSGTTSIQAEPNTTYISLFNTGFKPTPTTVALGTTVQWNNYGTGSHSATDSRQLGCASSPCALFDSGLMPVLSYYRFSFDAAGTYSVADSATLHTAQVAVAPTVVPGSGTTSTTFTVTWADQPAPAGYVYDVQLTKPGSTVWRSWLTGVTEASATFSSANTPLWVGPGTYSFRARLRNTGTTNASGYSHKVPMVVS